MGIRMFYKCVIRLAILQQILNLSQCFRSSSFFRVLIVFNSDQILNSTGVFKSFAQILSKSVTFTTLML